MADCLTDRRTLCLAGFGMLLSAPFAAAGSCPAFLAHEFRKLHSEQSINLCSAFGGKPLLIVNTASHCGYTPQFQALQALHEKYRGRGLVVIGFPSDDFRQESPDEAETAAVCFINYGVTFTMLAPMAVTGAMANPVFRELARQAREPDWNFNKYLVGPDGKVSAHFGSEVTPESEPMTAGIEKLLGATAAGG